MSLSGLTEVGFLSSSGKHISLFHGTCGTIVLSCFPTDDSFQTDLEEFMRIFVGSEFPHRTQVDKIIGPNPEGRARVSEKVTQRLEGLENKDTVKRKLSISLEKTLFRL